MKPRNAQFSIKWLAGFLVAVLAMSCFSAAFPGGAATLQLSGSIHYQTLDTSDGHTNGDASYKFSVTVRSNLWMVRVEAPVEETNLPANEYWYDGSLLYQVERWKTNLPHELPTSGSNYLGEATVNLDLSDKRMPIFDGTMCFPVWLAYASGDFFSTNAELLPNFLEMNGIYPDERFKFTKMTSTMRASPVGIMPETLVFSNIGKLTTLGLGGQTETVTLPPPFDHGFLVAEAQVTGWTNTGGVELPAKAELTCYTPMKGTGTSGATPKVAAFIKFSIVETSAKLLDDSFAFTPSLMGTLVRVRDHRILIDGKPPVYVTTNGMFNTNTAQYAKMLVKFDKREKEMERLESAPFNSHKKRQIIALILLICAASLPLLVWIIWRKNKTPETK